MLRILTVGIHGIIDNLGNLQLLVMALVSNVVRPIDFTFTT
jgi:hypothetical protein